MVDDDLFTPTITAETYRRRRAPWRPQSLLVPAVFGGPATVTVLALVNAGRLGADRSARLAVAGAGVAAVAVRLVLTSLFATDRPVLLVGALAGAAVGVVATRTQARPFRLAELRGDEPASLWWPGLAAVVLIGSVETLLLILVLG